MSGKDIERDRSLGDFSAFPMTKSLVLAVSPLLLSWLISCSTPNSGDASVAPPEQTSVMLTREAQMIDDLASLRTADEMRVYLRGELEEGELDHVGFDQVTIAQCIDQVVMAARDERSASGGRQTRERLTESLQIYYAATREAAVRRSAGAASCLPLIR